MSIAATVIARATVADAEEILALQKLAYQSEAELYDDWSIPPLTQSIEALRKEFADSVILKAMLDERLLGSVRARSALGVCTIGRLVVHPEFQGRGIGSKLLLSIEATFPESSRYELFTGSLSEANIRLYVRHGYRIARTQRLTPTVTLTFMQKPAAKSVDNANVIPADPPDRPRARASGGALHAELIKIRTGRTSDVSAIRELYVRVEDHSGTLARLADEVTEDYVNSFVSRSLVDGVLFVAEVAGIAGLAGELHAYRNGLKRFAHVLGGLTVAVHPETQGKGVGRRLFESMLAEVRLSRPEINRIELITSENNARALRLYESLGFRREGRFEGAIQDARGGVETDIPMAWLRQTTTT